jgi:hypothetical protein
MNIEHSKKTNYLGEFIIGVGSLLFLCLAPALCSIFYYFSTLQPQTSAVNPFATSLPPTTSTPHMIPAEQKNADVIFKDDFSDDSHGWEDGENWYKAQVALGKLLLESLDQGYYATAECGLCPTLKSPFYLQADFSTGREIDNDYGIYFNYDKEDNFFLLTINPQAGRYYIYQNYNDVWALVASGKSQEIKKFPAINTLGIYASKDRVELYVNGKLIDSYQQSGHSFHEGDFGFYSDDAGFQLIVDNLIITQAGNH